MIQLYRRGLLKKELPFGIRSRMRETLLMEAIEAENVQAMACNRLQVASALIGPAPLQPQARQRLLRDYQQDLRYYDYIRYLDYDGAERYKFDNSSLALEAVYEMLERSGVIPEQHFGQPEEA